MFEPAATDPLVQAVERAVAAGIVVVVSAGHNGKNPETGMPGYAGITSPGNAPSAITVGALDIGAIRLARAVDTSIPTGQYWLTTNVAPVDIIASAALAWSQRLVWGDRIVWGDRLVWGDRIVGDRSGLG